MLTPDMFEQIVKRANLERDIFARTMCNWCVAVLFGNVTPNGPVVEEETTNSTEADMKAVRQSYKNTFLQLAIINLENMVRRAAMIREQGEDEDGIKG